MLSAQIRRHKRRAVRTRPVVSLLAAVASLAIGSTQAWAAAPDATACGDTLKAAFKPDGETRVVQVAYFHKGEPLTLGGAVMPNTPQAASNVCLVKLVVGPGNPGPAGAPSTSAGIGIEVWLPDSANWNGRLHALGGGGWQGGPAGVAGAIANLNAAMIAGQEGAVSSTTDTGHTVMNGGFAMLPNGAINSTLWADFASRAIHEQAVKSKALAKLYYGTAPRHSYWEGGSTGGRQGLNLAQNHPEDFDGIIAMFPAINWTRFITSELYPQIVYQRDLGGRALTKGQLDLVSRAAIAACDTVGGEHLGYILDPVGCRYNPARDRKVLCLSAGGQNTGQDCVTTKQAVAVNKIWYGMTIDGSAPDPARDNGWAEAYAAAAKPDARKRWSGLSRGTTLYLDYPGFEGLANPDHPFSIATHVVALEMQDPAIAEPKFENASGNGQSKWKGLSYAQLSAAYARGVALQSQFGNINSDKTDLSAFERRGGKLLTWHGMADEVIPTLGTVRYYKNVARTMGGIDRLRNFYRLYLVPGLGHGTPNGTANRNAVIPNFAPGQMYSILTGWVEGKSKAPAEIVLKVGQEPAARSMPVCPYPEVIKFTQGNPANAASYTCLRVKRK